MRKQFSILILVMSICVAVGTMLSGCGAMNDNPTSADQMQSIRKREADSRKNFNPTVTPPPSSPKGQ